MHKKRFFHAKSERKRAVFFLSQVCFWQTFALVWQKYAKNIYLSLETRCRFCDNLSWQMRFSLVRGQCRLLCVAGGVGAIIVHSLTAVPAPSCSSLVVELLRRWGWHHKLPGLNPGRSRRNVLGKDTYCNFARSTWRDLGTQYQRVK